MVAGAGVRIDAESFADDSFSIFLQLEQLRFHAALFVQRAFALRDDDLRAFFFCRERFLQGVAHHHQVVGARDCPHPFDTDSTNRVGNRELRCANGVRGLRGKDVLTARGGGVAVVYYDQDVVTLIENGVAHTACQTVVPEPAIAHKTDRALAGFLRVQRSGAGPTETVAHRRRANIERRKDREEVAPDVASNVVWTQFTLD